MDMVHVPYKGGSPALTAVVAGEVQLTIVPISVALGQIKAGKVRPLAVTSPKRFAALPEIPTFAEAGLPGFEAQAWVALLAPAGTPSAIVRKVSDDVSALVATPEMKQFLADQGLEPVGSSPEKLREFIRTEIELWGKVVKASGARPEQ
jgi:tripartite-type tricarboxylate transporter receptor subunit TctC